MQLVHGVRLGVWVSCRILNIEITMFPTLGIWRLAILAVFSSPFSIVFLILFWFVHVIRTQLVAVQCLVLEPCQWSLIFYLYLLSRSRWQLFVFNCWFHLEYYSRGHQGCFLRFFHIPNLEKLLENRSWQSGGSHITSSQPYKSFFGSKCLRQGR